MKKMILSLLLSVVFAVTAFSQTMDMNNMVNLDDMIGTCIDQADKMGLTDDQVIKMKPIHRETQKRLARYNTDLKIAENLFMKIMEVKNFDIKKANEVVKKVAELQTIHQFELLKTIKQIRTSLTAEQFERMKMMMSMKTDKKESNNDDGETIMIIVNKDNLA